MSDFIFPPLVMNSALIVAAISLFSLVIRQILPWRIQQADVAQHLRDDLLARVTKLEKKIERDQIRHNAERSLDSHRLNNVTQCFDSMLMLIEMNPDRAVEVVTMVKELRARQVIAEAEEKAIIRAAEITANEEAGDHDGN